jgi:hypothetical protein
MSNKMEDEPLIRFAFPTDEHHPYSDPKARSVALKIVEDFKPHIMSAGSDGVDFYGISKFSKDPERKVIKNIQVEIDTWKASQREWNDAAPQAEKKYLIGNHELRLIKYLHNKADELYSLEVLKFHNLLGFKELGVTYAKNDEINILNKLLVTHGTVVRKYSGYTAKGEAEKVLYGINVLTGHSHRGGTHYARTRQGIVQAQEGFCLCNLEQGYVKFPNWQQGIVLATVTRRWIQMEPIVIHTKGSKRIAVWRDREYTS